MGDVSRYQLLHVYSVPHIACKLKKNVSSNFINFWLIAAIFSKKTHLAPKRAKIVSWVAISQKLMKLKKKFFKCFNVLSEIELRCSNKFLKTWSKKCIVPPSPKSTQTLNPFLGRNRARNEAFYGKNRLVLRPFLFQMVKTACSKLPMFSRYLRSKFAYFILYVV